MAPLYMSRDRFLEEYDYAVEQDLGVNGVSASWADEDRKAAHRYWGDENYRIEVPRSGQSQTMEAAFAISSDGELLAVAGGNLITIYHLKSKEMRSQLKAFIQGCQRLFFVPSAPGSEEFYQLISQSRGVGESEEELLFWKLDQFGRRVDAVESLQASNLAQKSLDAIVPTLTNDYGLSHTSQLVKQVLDDYTSTLERLGSRVETRNLEKLKGSTPTFCKSPLSPDGKLLLFLRHNHSTQGGPRPPSELPHIIVYDVTTHAEKFALGGHEDAIMWTAFSPDMKSIASACWDQTFRIWDASSGECTHIIGPTGGQNWAGAWSPDSKHVLLSGREKTAVSVAVYSRDTGEEVARFDREHLGGWARRIDWSANGEVAIGNKSTVWIWRPFENDITSKFGLKAERPMESFTRFHGVQWVEKELLVIEPGDGTREAWDSGKNVKWRFQRPKGAPACLRSGGVSWISKDRTLVSLDSDGYLRFYEL